LEREMISCPLYSNYVTAYNFILYVKKYCNIYRKKITSSNGEIHNNISFWWNSGTRTSSTLPSLAFDNDLYQRAPQQTIVGTTDIIQTGEQDSPLTIENNIYQQPEEQTILMTLDVDQFDNDLQ
jgi:hypothetical protein